LTLRAELPGLSEKELDISVTANVLTVKAARRAKRRETNAIIETNEHD
jgi:HSP20 family molecular chaperone IbpA